MELVNNAILLFCKPPVPGLVKTRLTKGNGGTLTNEEAAEFFKNSLLDVAELCMSVVDDLNADNEAARAENPSREKRHYELFVSTVSEDAVDALKGMFVSDETLSGTATFIVDRGASFDDHFDDAFRQIFDQGFDAVVAVGGDMPMLPRRHLLDAFYWLERLAADDELGRAFVQAPCQQSGVSLVAQTRTTPITAKDVYYNRTGLPALDAYTEKLNKTEIPNMFLDPVSDVDNDNDLAHAISCLNAVAVASLYRDDLYVARRVLEWVDKKGLQVVAPPNDEHDPRQYIDGKPLNVA